MAIYNISLEGITRLNQTNFHTNGILERQHLQKYLRDQIEIISGNTLIIAEEFSDWDDSKKRIDLLGINKEANLVVIELKRSDTGDHMDLQALRYASMVSIMSFEKCISIFQKYIDSRDLQQNAQEELMKFLEWESPLQNDFASDVEIILASADFSKELTTSVMWLITKGINIKCIKLAPYIFDQQVLLDITQIIPLPEAEQYLIQIKERNVERQYAMQSSRDNTKYLFNNKLLGKGRFVLEVVREYLYQNPKTTFGELQAIFPPTFQGSTGVVNTLRFVNERYRDNKIKRHFINDNEVLLTGDGIEIVVSTEWGIGNIHHITDFARNEGYIFEEN